MLTLFRDQRIGAGLFDDLGSGWDLDAAREFYLGSLFDVDPAQLRRSRRYLELSRAVSGELPADVVGEWR